MVIGVPTTRHHVADHLNASAHEPRLINIVIVDIFAVP